MAITIFTLSIATTVETDIESISDEVHQCQSKACPAQGCMPLLIPRDTAALTPIDYEPGAIADLQTMQKHNRISASYRCCKRLTLQAQC